MHKIFLKLFPTQGNLFPSKTSDLQLNLHLFQRVSVTSEHLACGPDSFSACVHGDVPGWYLYLYPEKMHVLSLSIAFSDYITFTAFI